VRGTELTRCCEFRNRIHSYQCGVPKCAIFVLLRCLETHEERHLIHSVGSICLVSQIGPPVFDLNRAGKVDDRSCGPYSENPDGVGRVRTGHGGTWKSGRLKEWRARRLSGLDSKARGNLMKKHIVKLIRTTLVGPTSIVSSVILWTH
jgi:hypothetical protein